jgi:hypothetical protein
VTLPIPFKIQAVAEDPKNPLLHCYQESPDVLAKIFASAKLPTTPSPKKEKNIMSLNPVHITEAAPVITPVPGIQAYNVSNKSGMIRTLARLGFIPDGQQDKIEALAAHNMETGLKVDVYKLDQRLKTTGASISQRLAFKASLSHAGMLFVPR